MKGLFNVGFRDEEFEGLKFRSDNTRTKEYYDKLYEEGSHYSEVKYADGTDQDTMERIHIKLSYSLVIRIFSIILLVFSFGLTFMRLFWPALGTLGASAILFTISFLLNRKANEMYAMRESTRSLVGLVFADRQKDMEKERQEDKDGDGIAK